MFSVNPLRHVWVVDDDPLMHEVWFAAIGEDQEFELKLFHSGAEVINALEETSGPQLLVIDMNLSDTSGDQLLQELRNLPNFHRTAVIICSANLSSCKDEAGTTSPPIGWMKKPLNIIEIKNQIRTFWREIG